MSHVERFTTIKEPFSSKPHCNFQSNRAVPHGATKTWASRPLGRGSHSGGPDSLASFRASSWGGCQHGFSRSLDCTLSFHPLGNACGKNNSLQETLLSCCIVSSWQENLNIKLSTAGCQCELSANGNPQSGRGLKKEPLFRATSSMVTQRSCEGVWGPASPARELCSPLLWSLGSSTPRGKQSITTLTEKTKMP